MVLVAGKMYRPTGIAFNIAMNEIFVVEQFNHRVSKWTYSTGQTDFTLDTSWGNNNSDGTTGEGAPVTGVTDNALYRPSGIIYDGTRVVVTDTFHNRIRTIDRATGAFLGSTGQGGFGDGDFYHPFGISADDGGSFLVVADELNHRAVKYTTGNTPTFASVLPDPSTGGSEFSAFNRPHGVMFNTAGTTDHFEITDSVTNVISSYDDTATTFENEQNGTPGSSTVPDTNLYFPSSGQGELIGGGGTSFANTRSNAIKTIADDDAITDKIVAPGTAGGELYYPESSVAFVNGINYLLVANTLNNRVEVFNQDTTFLTNFGFP